MATILLVEDDIPLLRLYEGALSIEHEVIPAQSVADAQRAIEQVHLDLVILDLHLPDAAGSVVLNYLTSQDHSTNLKVIVMTGFNDYKNTALPEGVIQVLSKPVTVSTLRRSVDTGLSKTNSRIQT